MGAGSILFWYVHLPIVIGLKVVGYTERFKKKFKLKIPLICFFFYISSLLMFRLNQNDRILSGKCQQHSGRSHWWWGHRNPDELWMDLSGSGLDLGILINCCHISTRKLSCYLDSDRCPKESPPCFMIKPTFILLSYYSHHLLTLCKPHLTHQNRSFDSTKLDKGQNKITFML